MIRLTYFYSACVGIETPDVSILCDPWFTDGVFDGAWYQYPPTDRVREKIGRFDLVYVSHIHADHYDPVFLKAYLAKSPSTTVIIGQFRPNFLAGKMKADDIEFREVVCERFGHTELAIFLNKPGDPAYVDSALVVKTDGHAVVNMNDNGFNERQLNEIKAFCGVRPKIALLAYTGAGPYPQTYYDDEARLGLLAEAEKQAFFDRYRRMAAFLDAEVNIPFAGKFLLGGKLARLNRWRGFADAVEVREFDPRAMVLDDGGDAYIDTSSLEPSRERMARYDSAAMAQYVEEHLSQKRLHYETFFAGMPEEVLLATVMKLLPKAFRNAWRRSVVDTDWSFCVSLGAEWWVMNANRNREEAGFMKDVTGVTNRSEIYVDLRLLFGLLTTVFHWNNADIGSLYQVRRHPEVFDRRVQYFMHFFHV